MNSWAYRLSQLFFHIQISLFLSIFECVYCTVGTCESLHIGLYFWCESPHSTRGVVARLKCIKSPGKREAGLHLKARAGMAQPPLVSLDPRLPSFHHFSPLQVESVPELPRPFCHDLACLPPGSIGEAWRQISGPCKMILLRKGKTVNFQTFTNMG